MTDPVFTVAFALRLGLEPFADIDADYMCKRCGDRMGNSCTHSSLCKKSGSGARTERHDGVKYAVARAYREYHVAARVRVEPNIVRQCNLVAVDYAKSHRCRADLLVTDADGARIFDFVVANAAAASAPVLANKKTGVVAHREMEEKNKQYTKNYRGVVPGKNFFACAAEFHGALHPFFVGVLQELIDIKDDSGFDRETPKSVHASRLYERISVALQQSNAQAILDFRYAEIDVPEAAQHDAVMGVLNTKLLSLADCDADLLAVEAVEMDLQEELGAGGIVNGIDALVLEAQAEVQAEAGSILEEEVALAGGGEPEGIATGSAGVIASVLQFSGALAVVAE
jgi:hypothetical protein